jgi:glycerophosphoryl diester phosphodiesterase
MGATAPVWAPDHTWVDPEQIEEAHALGLEVIPWTVNEPTRMRRLIDWGIDGLITDRPDLARIVMQEAGLPLPPVRPG